MIVIRVFVLRNGTCERVRCMLMMQRVLHLIHEGNVTLICQHAAQRHAEHDERA
jgi:hypothetical protein